MRFLGWFFPLLLLVSAAYVPFMGARLVRTTGDEKVYVSQALEMERDGRWFVQTLQDQPDYYKGPLHFLLVRAGMKLFGKSPWAIFYMNLIFITLGALALASIVSYYRPQWTGGPVWTGAFFALGVGIYSHAFVSQMEVELAGLFAIALYFLDGTDVEEDAFLFWIVAGIIGWVKAPLHSVFVGLTALLFWTLTGEIFKRILRFKSWVAVLTGILVCAAGYAPAYFLDRENFVNLFVLKEILYKSGTQQHWSVPLVSIFGFYLIPWSLMAFVAYAQGILTLPGLLARGDTRRLVILAVSCLLPSVGFFLWHPYRLENYHIPVISGVALLVAAIWSSRTELWDFFYRIAFGLTAFLLLTFPVLVTALVIRFWPLPEWWPIWVIGTVWAGALTSFVGFFKYGFLERARKPHYLAVSAVGIFLAIGSFASMIGEREMLDLRRAIEQAVARGENPSLAYYNLHRNIWSEWGILNFWVDRPVKGVHSEDQLRRAVKEKSWILVPGPEQLNDLKAFLAREFPAESIDISPWKRWRTQGKSSTDKPLWREAWDRKSFTILERDFYLVRLNEDPGRPKERT